MNADEKFFGTFQQADDMDRPMLEQLDMVQDSDEDVGVVQNLNGLETVQQSISNEETSSLIEELGAVNFVQVVDGSTVTDNESPNSLNRAYLCSICDKAFLVQSECAVHEATHDVVAPYICVLCKFTCVDRLLLISHIKKEHDGKRPHICMQCQMRFLRRGDLRKHTVIHTGLRPYACLICQKKFTRNSNLAKHVEIHRSAKPHVCLQCRRSFSTTTELEEHTAKHLTDMNSQPQPARMRVKYECTICKRSFVRERDLQCHNALHLDSLLSCKQCGTRFSRREKLLKHEQECVARSSAVYDAANSALPSWDSFLNLFMPNMGLGYYTEQPDNNNI